MHIIYIAGCYTKETYEWCRRSYPKIPNLPGQKFHNLVVKGLSDNGVRVDILSHLPIGQSILKENEIKLPNENENGIEYHYLKTKKSKLNNIYQYIEYIQLIKELHKQDKSVVVICDVLRPSSVIPVQRICTKLGIRCFGIATDIPLKRAENGSLRTRIANIIAKGTLDRFDGYIFLTEAMNELVNRNNKPYVVTECLVDKEMVQKENLMQHKSYPRVLLYAGAIRKVYGVEALVEGFIKANIDDTELHIYGSGDYSEELKLVCKENKNVKFFGVAPNEYVVDEELKATLLVNPRPSEGEFTKFSFPSKNMEYMVSGTPLLGVKLPGIPKEYYKYMYTIDTVSPEEISQKLKELFSLSNTVLHEKGLSARNYVLENKQNSVQAKRILDMIYGC